MSKTKSERITEIESQITQLENQRKKLMQEQKEAEHKARTKRLIERGAILESLIAEADTLTNEQIKAFLEETVKTADAKKVLANLKAPKAERPAENQTSVSTQPVTV